eukprot:scaffold147573_cov41-Prasinocladus_malaysianus.AAC.1
MYELKLLRLVHLVPEIQRDSDGQRAEGKGKAPGELVACPGGQADSHDRGGEQVTQALAAEGRGHRLAFELGLRGLARDGRTQRVLSAHAEAEEEAEQRELGVDAEPLRGLHERACQRPERDEASGGDEQDPTTDNVG